MGQHKPFDRNLFGTGEVKTSGKSLDLAKGTLALADVKGSTPDGVPLLANPEGYKKSDKRFKLKMGRGQGSFGRSFGNNSMETTVFALNEVVDLKVSAPKNKEHIVDEVHLGYNGVDEGTAFSFNVGDRYLNINLVICGDALAYRGSGTMAKEVVNIQLDLPQVGGFQCQDPLTKCDDIGSEATVAVVHEAVRRLKDYKLAGGKTLSEFLEITAIADCDTVVPGTIDYKYYTLKVADSGTDNALNEVAAQYDEPVIRVDRIDNNSIYQTLKTGAAPADYDQTIASILKGCETCPPDYDAVPGGYLYTISIHDAGTDKTSDLESAFSNEVADEIIRQGNADGTGFYTVLLSSKMVESEWTAFLASEESAAREEIGKVEDICNNNAVTTTSWVEGDTCQAATEYYSIVLPDTNCGESRLTELQEVYKDLTVLEGGAENTVTLTLTGTTGTADINVGGSTDEATFASDLATTAANFVTANATDLLADEEVTVTSDGAVLTFVGPIEVVNAITMDNASDDLAGALAIVGETGGCARKYTAIVPTNMVCDQCDPIFEDFFTTEEPDSFLGEKWESQGDSLPSGNCLTGIRVKGKIKRIAASEAYRDQIQFMEDSVQIKSLVANFPAESGTEGIGNLPKGQYTGRRISYYARRTHLGGDLLKLEQEGRVFFHDTPHYDAVGRELTGTTSLIEDLFEQYVDYAITISHFNHTQGMASRTHRDNTYHFLVPVGRHEATEALLNNIATSAGVDAVKAFASV